MKKLVSILLLLVFLFNLTGYHWMLRMIDHHYDERFSQQIDRSEYDEKELVEVRVQLNLPYYQNTDFEQQYGTTDVQGVTYHYVARKVENGTLILKCLPDRSKQTVKSKASDYFNDINGLSNATNSKKEGSKGHSKFLPDDYEEIDLSVISYHELLIKHQFNLKNTTAIADGFVGLPELPPDLV